MTHSRKTKSELLDELETLRARLIEQERARVCLEEIIKETAFEPAAGKVHFEVVEEEQTWDELVQALHNLQNAYEEMQVAEQELRQQNEELAITRLEAEKERNRYQGLFDSAPDGYLVTDIKGIIREANRLAELMFSVLRQELSGKPLVNFVVKKQRREFITRLSEFKESHESQTWELRIQPQERAPFDAEITVVQAYDPSDKDTIIRWLIRDITERKRAEQALRESEEDLNRAQAVAHTGSWQLNVRKNELCWSTETHRIFGIPPGTPLTYERFLNSVHPDDREYVDRSWKAALRGAPYDIEHRIVVRETVKWVRERAELEFDAHGELLGGFGTVQDITERKEAEEALARERELLQRIFDNIPVMLVLWDPRLQRFTLNRHAEAVMGWTTADANDGDFMSKVYPDPAYRARVAEYMQSLGAGWREWVVTTKDGKHVPSSWANIRLTDDTMIGIGVDLRERKQAEEALRQANEWLKIAQWAAEAGIWDWDITTGTLQWSPKLFDLLGLDPRKTVASFEVWDSVLHPEDREKAHSQIDEAIRQHTFMDSESRIVRPDGQTRWINALGQGIYDEQGNPLRMSGICIDITERKQMEQALRESEARFRNLSESLEETVKQKTEELLQAEHLAAIGQMVSTVAHEIRNPIQIIKAGVDFLRQPPSGENARQEILEEIEYGARMLEGTIADLLQYARPLTLDLTFVTVEHVVESALRLLGDRLKNIGTHVELERGDEEIRIDAVKLTQVIANLVSNAADAMPDGGSLTIRSRILQSDEARLLEISITDTGHGIDEKHLQDIFKPFFTTKMRGTGLGLSLSKKIMDAHGGTISIMSKSGEGTTVHLALPIK